MAYIRQELLGSAGRRPPIKRKPELIQEIRAGRGSRLPRLPGRGTPKIDWNSLRNLPRLPLRPGDVGMGGPRHGGPRFDMSGDVMQMPPRGPRGFPGMGDYTPPPPPGFYESDSMGGGLGPDGMGVPQMPGPMPGPQRPSWEGRLNQSPLIMMILEQLRASRGRSAPPGGSYM